ncbi:larval cuticle protein A1A-like [Ischnura elegans]|uniref:larval cuticle protein A1A-like n=1 Tax=Ischnura elegans TaxID=197161 RepID=UPI001ED8A618|nr:larval cuticle protein A1A-like [Ischnura elegans]
MKVLVVISAVLAVAVAGDLGFAYSSVAPYWNGAYGAYPYSAYPYSAYPYTGLHGFRAAVAAPVAAPVAPIAAPIAAPYAYNVAPYAYHGALATKSQYHAQDEFGQASFGHATHDQAHSAVRDAFGGVTGSYSYVNPEGKVVQAHYTADAVHGFRVASNDLPVAPAVPEAPVYPELVAPEPVQDTPEVVAARAEHLAAHAEAKSRSRRQAILSPFAYAHHGVLPYAHGVLPYAAQHVRPATLTTVVNNPGHAISYRVD